MAPTESITTAGGTYSGPAGYAPGSITSPTTPGQNGPTPGNGYTPPTGETLVGSGYGPPAGANAAGVGQVVTDRTGGQYAYLGSPQQALAIQGSGGQLYFQSNPGVFSPQTYGSPTGPAPGTPTFAKVG